MIHFPFRLVMWKLQTIRGSGAPTDVPTILKIVEALFPKGAPRESYLSDVALEVPLFQISELKLVAKRLESGKAPGPNGIPNEVLEVTIWENPQLILDLQFNTCLERGHFPKKIPKCTPEISFHIEGQRQGSQGTIFLETVMYARLPGQAL